MTNSYLTITLQVQVEDNISKNESEAREYIGRHVSDEVLDIVGLEVNHVSGREVPKLNIEDFSIEIDDIQFEGTEK
ncbi:hypothetical protein [Alkalihalobacillus sp. 1P02AB]|uniref:hypothetical protein n=1 Tax=Alkalihalobacillus sp. 1P02AB TaxID=3132260 RepID=UPI0039A40458